MRKMLSAAALAALYPMLHTASVSASISDYYGSYSGYQSDEEGIVTAILNTNATTNTFLIQDGSASVIAYSIPVTAYVPTIGDDIEFDAYNTGYQDAPELVATNAAGNFNIERVDGVGNVVAPYLLTIPQVKSAGTGLDPNNTSQEAVAPYAESLATIDNVNFNSAYASLSTTTNTAYYIHDSSGNGIELYDYKSDSAVLAAVTAADLLNPTGFSGTYDITGYVDVYYGTSEFYPTSIVAVAPVPEPVSLGLIGVGGLALLGRRRRRI